MKLFVSALEYSANIHLKYLLCELIKHENIELCGIFDKNIIDEIMRDSCGSILDEKSGLRSCEQGNKTDSLLTKRTTSLPDLSLKYNALQGKPLCDISEVSVMGFIDVLKRARFFLTLRAKCLAIALKADKILLMDSSSFNIPLAKKIKARDLQKEIMYYILPQVWAWKPWRAKTIEANCDKLAAILPFEVECYAKKARFVGHPLLDEIKYFRDTESTHPLAPSAGEGEFLDCFDSHSKSCNDGFENNIITFMPGSRITEIKRIFPIFLQVKDEIKRRDLATQFHLVIPRKFMGKNLAEIYGDLSDFIISFDTHTSLLKSKFAFICSGTATLECALIGTPFVLGYLARRIEAFVVKQFLNIRFVGLANILYSRINKSENFHDELLQENLTAKNLLDSYYHANPNDFLVKSLSLRKYLKNGSAKAVAQWLFQT